MIWVRFPYGVMYRGEHHIAGADIPVLDDDLAQLEAKGAKIVRCVESPDPQPKEKSSTGAAAKPKTVSQTASAKRRGRKPKSA